MVNKVVLITGCSSGVGKALALQLVKKGGYTVYATMRNLDKATSLKTESQELGEKASHLHIKQLDVTNDKSVSTALAEILEAESGKIDVLANNAGYSLTGPVEGISMDAIAQQFDCNVYGPIRMIKAVLPAMRKNKGGRIVNISSIGGVWGQPFSDVYCSSKFALEGLIESMSSYCRLENIHLTLMEPGAIQSAFWTNLQGPDMTKVPVELHRPMTAVRDYYTERSKNGSTAQTPVEVANDVIATMETERPPLRVQTNAATKPISDAIMRDATGNTQVNLALNTMFKDLA